MSDRYARLAAIDWWDGELVRGAVAVVAGAGALGNEVVKNLVLLGWGTIIVIDYDMVEESNLTRSVFFQQEDVGQPKAEVLAARAGQVNPDSRMIGLCGDLRLALSAGIANRSDVVFGCLDTVGGRVALNQLTRRAGRVLIDGGLTTWEGTVQVFPADPAMPCFTCGLGEDDLRELMLRQSCLAYERRAIAAGGLATTPTVASATAAMMVQEGVKWLHQDLHELPVAAGRELRIDLAHNRFWSHALPVSKDCALHWDPASVDRRDAVAWDSGWGDLVAVCRRAVSTDGGALNLPVRLLLRWDCLECGAGAEILRAHAGDGEFLCPACASPAVPRFAVAVTGDEPWADLSPAEMGFPPWTWLELAVGGHVTTFEVAGVLGPLSVLDRGDHCGDAPA